MKRTTWQPSSRLIGQRQREQQARKHVANLLRVRSSVDMSAPKSMTYAKGKNAKKKEKRASGVDYDANAAVSEEKGKMGGETDDEEDFGANDELPQFIADE